MSTSMQDDVSDLSREIAISPTSPQPELFVSAVLSTVSCLLSTTIHDSRKVSQSYQRTGSACTRTWRIPCRSGCCRSDRSVCTASTDTGLIGTTQQEMNDTVHHPVYGFLYIRGLCERRRIGNRVSIHKNNKITWR